MTYYSNKPRPMLEQPTLSYFIEDLENNVIEIKTERFKSVQDNPKTDSEFYTFNTPKGRFKFGILAHWGSIITDPKDIENQSLDLNTFNYKFNGLVIINNPESYVLRINDFHIKSDLMKYPISLSRLNSVIEILIKDEIPQNIGYILFGGKLPSRIYPFKYGIYKFDEPRYLLFKTISLDIKSGNSLRSIIYGTEDVQEYEIQVYDFDKKLVFSKKIPNIFFKENHITRLTGKLFDKTDQIGFKVQLVKDYANDIIKVNY